MRLLGLSGKQNSGKSTAAQYLTTKHGYAEFSLAHPIKMLCAELLGLPSSFLFGESDLREVQHEVDWAVCQLKIANDSAYLLKHFVLGRSPLMHEIRAIYDWSEYLQTSYGNLVSARDAARTLGHEFGRLRFGDDVWVKALHLAIVTHQSEHPAPVVVSDVRYPGEIAYVQSKGGKVFRICRTQSREATTHASETALDGTHTSDFDAVIHNDGSRNDLYRTLDTLLGVCK